MTARKPAPPVKAPPPDDPAQSRRFIEMAKEVGADEAPEADMFQRVVRRLGDTPKEPRQTKGKLSGKRMAYRS